MGRLWGWEIPSLRDYGEITSMGDYADGEIIVTRWCYPITGTGWSQCYVTEIEHRECEG